MSDKAEEAARKNKGKRANLPSRDALLDWLKDNPGQSGKREVARAFGLKGQQKIALKAMLKELESEGEIRKRGKRYAAPGALPPVSVLDIIERDDGGALVARPVEWDEAEDGPRPTVTLVNHPRSKAPSAGVGDRVLARISEHVSGGLRAKVMKVLDKNRALTLGVYRTLLQNPSAASWVASSRWTARPTSLSCTNKILATPRMVISSRSR